MNNLPGDLNNRRGLTVCGCFGAAFTSPVLLVPAAGAQQPRLYLPFKSPGISRMLTKVESLEFEWGKGRNDAMLAFLTLFVKIKKRKKRIKCVLHLNKIFISWPEKKFTFM